MSDQEHSLWIETVKARNAGAASTCLDRQIGAVAERSWLLACIRVSHREVDMVRAMRVLCAAGDEVIAGWDTDTVSPDRLREIETEFKEKMAEGWFAVDIHDKRNQLIRQFDPNAEILLIPRVQGG